MESRRSTVAGDPAFRRQYVLGPTSQEALSGWHRHRVDDNHVLSVHPDLPYTRVEAGERSIVLLGYVLDPRNPGRDDRAVLTAVLGESETTGEVIEAFAPLSGRWVALYGADGGLVVFHDAAGTRPVFHWRDGADRTWCSSQASLLGQLLDLPADGEHRRELLRDGYLNPAEPHFWPGGGSAVLGVRRLLPNHYLDVRTGRTHRYWPVRPIASVEPEVAIERCAPALTGTIAAAAARYPLALSISAGMDSRLLLAASREHAERMTFYTYKKTRMSRGHPDIRVPRRMLGDLGLRHKVITAHAGSTGPIADAIKATCDPYHQSTIDQVVALAADPPRQDGRWMTVNGNVSEVARRIYPPRPMTGENCATAVMMGRSAFAAEQFEAWHDRAEPAIAVSGINPWDLFFWEQRLSSWLATVRTEFDLVEDAITPYNSRALLECMLGVDESLRIRPECTFHRDLITAMWPRVMDYPINPPSTSKIIKRRYQSALRAGRRLVGSGAEARR